MIVLDTSFLVLLLDPAAKPPTDPATNAPVTHCKKRIEFFLADLTKKGEKVLIPTPSLSEFLVGIKSKHGEYISIIQNSYKLKIGAFDERAAIELAFLTDADLQSNKRLSPTETKAKVKFDRQILAIAKVNGAHTICCDDNNLADRTIKNGLKIVRIWDLPLPPDDIQGKLTLEANNDKE